MNSLVTLIMMIWSFLVGFDWGVKWYVQFLHIPHNMVPSQVKHNNKKYGVGR